jgi:hypothetical protein
MSITPEVGSNVPSEKSHGAEPPAEEPNEIPTPGGLRVVWIWVCVPSQSVCTPSVPSFELYCVFVTSEPSFAPIPQPLRLSSKRSIVAGTSEEFQAIEYCPLNARVSVPAVP